MRTVTVTLTKKQANTLTMAMENYELGLLDTIQRYGHLDRLGASQLRVLTEARARIVAALRADRQADKPAPAL